MILRWRLWLAKRLLGLRYVVVPTDSPRLAENDRLLDVLQNIEGELREAYR